MCGSLAALNGRIRGTNRLSTHSIAGVDPREDRVYLGPLVALPARLLDSVHILRLTAEHTRGEHREGKLLRRKFACVDPVQDAEIEDGCPASLARVRLAAGTEIRDAPREQVSWRGHCWSVVDSARQKS